MHFGGCHCGNVRYETAVDPRAASSCNCTLCVKLGILAAIVKPAGFRLLTDAAKLTSYSTMPDVVNRYFCARCHVYCFGKGHIAELGGDFVSVNMNTLDDFDPSAAKVVYWDGRHDNWEAGSRPTPWPVSA
jgi:hypothetical protein